MLEPLSLIKSLLDYRIRFHTHNVRLLRESRRDVVKWTLDFGTRRKRHKSGTWSSTWAGSTLKVVLTHPAGNSFLASVNIVT